jgi:hypothetical protein
MITLLARLGLILRAADFDPFDMYRNMPSHQERLAAEKKTNVYFIPGQNKSDQLGYIYVVCSAMLHDDFVENIRLGVIPPYAVIVETGSGDPTVDVKKKMLDYYGFDHDEAVAGSN